MAVLANYALVFVAGLLSALATGLGALPFFVVDEVKERWTVALWGLASGIMVAASVFGLIFEGLAEGTVLEILPGVLVGALLVEGAGRAIDDHEFAPREIARADFKKLVLILGVLTVHSFPEGVAVGVSFADLNLAGGVPLFGFLVPVLAVFMTLAISVHNIPEGLAISIPLSQLGMSKRRMVAAAVFSSLPQPVGAVVAFAFVRWARAFLPFGFGFAAGAMVYLVATEFVPEALETGRSLPSNGYPEFAAGFAVGAVGMVPLLFV